MITKPVHTFPPFLLSAVYTPCHFFVWFHHRCFSPAAPIHWTWTSNQSVHVPDFPGNASALTVFHVPGWAVRSDQLSHILWISGSPSPHCHLPHLFLLEQVFILQDNRRHSSSSCSSGRVDDLEHKAMKEESGNLYGRTHLLVSSSFLSKPPF